MAFIIRCRKLPKCIWVPMLLITALYTWIILVRNGNQMEDRYNYKKHIMEELIDDADNRGECRIPDLPTYSKEMMSFNYDEPPLKCDPNEDWVSCAFSLCSVKQSIIAQRGLITCQYSEILRDGDMSIKYGPTTKTTQSYMLKESDFVHVKCYDPEWNYWSGLQYGLVEKNHTKNSEQPKLNVLIYGFDSLSRNSFIRKLPKTYAILTKELGADVLQGYNIVGDGTPQALIPLLTGFTELELPETRRRMRNSQSVNVYPFIWKKYERYGYVTSFNEDLPQVGTFSYRLNGFDAQPTTQYMRPYYLALQPKLSEHKRLCVGNQPRHQVMLDYTTNFMNAYPGTPHFAFSFHGELSHDSINLVGVADDDIAVWLKNLEKSGILENTILIMMSDHGNRFASVRDTLQGKLEERLPFFSFVFPKSFKQGHDILYQNFKENTKRLTTPFDIHETLEHILDLQTKSNIRIKPHNTRGISLLDRVDKDRSCAEAYIEPHWCSCLNWRPINDTQDETVLKVARAVVKTINNFTESNQNICARLHLHEVKWAAKLAPHDNLLRFKQTNDGDGFLADLSSATTATSEMYQVKLVLRPGDSIFEASVQHLAKDGHFVVRLSDISRVNKYGDQAACIYDKNPELRKYCYCHDGSSHG